MQPTKIPQAERLITSSDSPVAKRPKPHAAEQTAAPRASVSTQQAVSRPQGPGPSTIVRASPKWHPDLYWDACFQTRQWQNPPTTRRFSRPPSSAPCSAPEPRVALRSCVYFPDLGTLTRAKNWTSLAPLRQYSCPLPTSTPTCERAPWATTALCAPFPLTAHLS